MFDATQKILARNKPAGIILFFEPPLSCNYHQFERLGDTIAAQRGLALFVKGLMGGNFKNDSKLAE